MWFSSYFVVLAGNGFRQFPAESHPPGVGSLSFRSARSAESLLLSVSRLAFEFFINRLLDDRSLEEVWVHPSVQLDRV
jgi:hypothetical protein